MLLFLLNLFYFTIELTQLWIRLILTMTQSIVSCFIPSNKKSVDGKIVLITGAGSGIGRELAYRFAELKAIVVLWDINKSAVNATAQKIRKKFHDVKVYSYEIDVTDEARVTQTAFIMKKDIGNVYMVINNAAIVPCKPLIHLNSNEIRRTLEVNTLSHFWILKNYIPQMEEAGEGHIVLIGSSAGIKGCTYFTAYSASKFGATGLMESLSQELYETRKDQMIKTTIISPLGISGTGLIIPTRTRFPWLLPILTVESAVGQMVDGILREKTHIIMPKGFKILHLILRNFPERISRLIYEFLDYSIEPVFRTHINSNPNTNSNSNLNSNSNSNSWNNRNFDNSN